jgi:hypothetical protein
LSTRALGSSDRTPGGRSSASPAVRLVRYLDLLLLALALPVFVVAGFPLVGYAVAAGAWIAQRLIRVLLERRAAAASRPGAIAVLLAVSMLCRGWLVALAILLVGLLHSREAGLAAGLLCLALFSVDFGVRLALRPLESRRGRP